MKRFLRILLAGSCLLGCFLLYRLWVYGEKAAPLVGFVSTAQADMPDPFLQVRSTLEDDGVRTQTLTACTDLTAAVEQLVGAGAEVIVFHIENTLPDADFTAAARRAGAAMIFAGQVPVRALNAQYDKIWYLGSAAAHAGELIGQQVAEAFRNGSLPDADGDLKLDYVTVGNGSETAAAIHSAAKWEYEHYGVVGSDCDTAAAQSRSAAPVTAEELAERWSALAQKPEVVFCVGTEYALAAHQAAERLGWLSGEAPVMLAAVTESEAAAQQLLTRGGLCALAHYDAQAQAQALCAMTRNLLQQRDVAFGTGLRRDIDEPRFDLPYVAVEIELPVPTAVPADE